MKIEQFVWSAPDWVYPVAAGLALVALLVLSAAYIRTLGSAGVRRAAATLKLVAFIALLLCLLEPSLSGMRPRPGMNLFLLLADNSQSLGIRDAGASISRGSRMQGLLASQSSWQIGLGQAFDIRRYQFDSRLQGVDDFQTLMFDGTQSTLTTSLRAMVSRFHDRPVAGVLLFSDGNATDLTDAQLDVAGLPPVYPVLLNESHPMRDVGIQRVSVSQTSFEAAPITIQAEAKTYDCDETIIFQLLNESGDVLQTEPANASDDGDSVTVRFQHQPEHAGILFYRVRVFAESDKEQFESAEVARVNEATLANNERLVRVDRGGGPYRVLYVTGRPNWEFKFLRRAAEGDDEIQLVGLIRIAKREPKFDFRSRKGESTNPLYRGFGDPQDETAEQYDEPVLIRLGTADQEELQGGFPKAADALFAYDAIILDDVEAGFFTQDQMLLLQKFVSFRGGGFLMLGGNESFIKGGYRRTPIGELLPVYVNQLPKTMPGMRFTLALTQEGWLQPWIRLRSNEDDERKRLEKMPEFETVNRVSGIKPGATVLASVTLSNKTTQPALVTQNFGKGRSAALLIGDLWRWALERQSTDPPDDWQKAWRQTLRWLVANVPRRIEVDISPGQDERTDTNRIAVRVLDEEFQPLDNATVTIEVKTPDGNEITLPTEPSPHAAGTYETRYVCREPGAYRATVSVSGADGSDVGQREAGWSFQPETDEFNALDTNRAFLKRLAEQTGGEVIQADSLDDFVASLPNRRVPITEHWIRPLWHHWLVLTFIVLCLTGEWGLRRWKGLP